MLISRAFFVGGKLCNAGGFAVFFASSVLLIEMVCLFFDELVSI